MNIQDWFLLWWTGWISLQCRGLSKVSPTPQFKSINSLVLSFLYSPALTSIHDYWKNHSFDYRQSIDRPLSAKWCLCFLICCLGWSCCLSRLSRLLLLPRRKHLLISWLQSPSAVILEPKKRKSASFHCFPIYLPWSDGTGCHDVSFLNVEL